MIDEHKTHEPMAGSYQLRCRQECARANLSPGDTAATIEAMNAIDRLSWKADKQVQALRDKIAWLEQIMAQVS